MIAGLAARSDGKNYGQLVTYRFPKQELVYGPLQIEGRIDQDPEISGQITLWNQSSSQVIRGNLLVLPLDNSLLYVEPLYLQAVNGQIPELKRVIVVSGDQVIMRETLAVGLQALFSWPLLPLTTTPPPHLEPFKWIFVNILVEINFTKLVMDFVPAHLYAIIYASGARPTPT